MHKVLFHFVGVLLSHSECNLIPVVTIRLFSEMKVMRQVTTVVLSFVRAETRKGMNWLSCCCSHRSSSLLKTFSHSSFHNLQPEPNHSKNLIFKFKKNIEFGDEAYLPSILTSTDSTEDSTDSAEDPRFENSKINIYPRAPWCE